MVDATWQQVWSAKGAAVQPERAPSTGTLERLMDLGGYTSPTAAGALSAYERHFRYVRDSLSIDTAPRYDVVAYHVTMQR